MIGEEQMRGYKDIKEDEEELNEFEERRKKALKIIGRSEEKKENEDVQERAKNALNDFEGLKRFKERVIEHDIIYLREQNNKIVSAINDLTKEISSLKKEFQKVKINE